MAGEYQLSWETDFLNEEGSLQRATAIYLPSDRKTFLRTASCDDTVEKMTEEDKALILSKLDEPPLERAVTPLEKGWVLVNDPLETLFPPPVTEKESAIQNLLDEMRADRERHEQAVTKRLEIAIAKEEALKSLIAAQKAWVQELVQKAESSGELVGAEEAAKSLDLSPSTLRYYAEQGIIPCFKMGRNRKYNLQEIRSALEKAREEGKIPRITAALRKRLLR